MFLVAQASACVPLRYCPSTRGPAQDGPLRVPHARFMSVGFFFWSAAARRRFAFLSCFS